MNDFITRKELQENMEKVHERINDIIEIQHQNQLTVNTLSNSLTQLITSLSYIKEIMGNHLEESKIVLDRIDTIERYKDIKSGQMQALDYVWKFAVAIGGFSVVITRLIDWMK